MAETKGYERYGLTGNPFRDLASETLENVDIFHVNQELDEHLKMIFDEIADKQSKAVVAVLGALGMGKTERLLLIANWARQRKAFCVVRSINPQAKLVVGDILRSIMVTAPLTFYEKNISTPKWFSDLKKAHKSSKKKFDPEKIGKAISGALNAKAPSILVLNDLHNVDPTSELPDFLQVLYSTVNSIDEGVMIIIGSNTAYFDGIMKRHQSLEERINYKLEVLPLSDTEAQELLAKRLTAKRLVEDLNPIYPFNNESISLINAEAYGNPRQLIKLSDRIIDQAATERIIQIDAQYVSEILKSAREKRSLPPAPKEILQKLREESARRGKAPRGQETKTAPFMPEIDEKIEEYQKMIKKMEDRFLAQIDPNVDALAPSIGPDDDNAADAKNAIKPDQTGARSPNIAPPPPPTPPFPVDIKAPETTASEAQNVSGPKSDNDALKKYKVMTPT